MTYLFAFLIGGAICAAAQLLIDLTRLTPARILVGTVVLGVLLGALGLYEPLLKVAGCGVSVPLIGFGGGIARGVREAVAKDGLLGVLSGPITAAAGGLGGMAILYGHQRTNPDITWIACIVTVIIVQVIQTVGMKIAHKTDKRINK